MPKHILVTGGAGFIGSHLVDRLVEAGYRVRVLDSLDPQVHGSATPEETAIGSHIRSGDVEFLQGDLVDPNLVARAVRDVDGVVHLAAAVGVGQSMYRVVDYVRTNTLGGATLLQAIIERDSPLDRLVVASSMSVYGEGLYACVEHGDQVPLARDQAQLERGMWEMLCPVCTTPMAPLPTPETKRLEPSSVYAITKRDHEELFLSIGQAYGVPTIALRFFNVYGPRQSLSNPYTGVAAIFASRLINDRPPLIFEDGHQSRDFVHVYDVARALMLSLQADDGAAGGVFNVGTGRCLSLRVMTDALRSRLGGPEPETVGKYRRGDIRHCFADTVEAGSRLGFEAQIAFEEGVEDLAEWASRQDADDRVEEARGELEGAGLTIG